MATRLSDQDVELLAKFAKALKSGDEIEAKKDFTWPHGEDGLITYPGARPDMYDLTPRVGSWAASLPMFPSLYQNEIIELNTGVTAQTGSNPTTTCGTPPTSGKSKIAQIIATWGQFYKATEEINLSEAGKLRNRADLPRRLRNDPYEEMSSNPFVPMPVGAGPASFNTALGKAFREFGQGAMLDFAYVDWRGDKAKTNAQAQLGFIKEYDGIDKWIKTGWTDNVSGAAVAALDSQVVNYNATVGASFVTQLMDMYRTLLTDAELIKLPNARWAIVMHPRAKFPIFDAWACNYNQARCLPTEANGQRLDQTAIVNLRNEMLRGNYLLIDGERVPVLTDAGIEATQAEGGLGLWTSDVYVVPLEDGKGNAITYREFMPYDFGRNRELAELAEQSFDNVLPMNGGLYLAGYTKTGAFCLKWHFTSKVRLILELPRLAGRLDNVQFESNTKFVDPYPGATYHKNGGTTWRVG